jgi:hypothetical protein
MPSITPAADSRRMNHLLWIAGLIHEPDLLDTMTGRHGDDTMASGRRARSESEP